MISVHQLRVTRGKREVLRRISLQIQPGKITVVLGKNGAGKTSLLEALTGALPVQDGRIVWDNTPFPEIKPNELATRRAVLSQNMPLNFPIPVFDLVEMGTYARYNHLTAAEREALVRRVLEQLRLTAFSTRNYQQLSGGERQRVLLAKCLVQLNCSRHLYPRQYLFLDEPTNSLDMEQQYNIMSEVSRIAKRQQIGVFAILHDINLAAQYADEVLLLKAGKIAYQGTPQACLTRESIQDVFNIHSIISRHPALDCPYITLLPHEVYNTPQTAIS